MRNASRPMMMLVCAAVWLLALTVSAPGAATLYRWVDDQGVVHVSENPPEGKMNVAQSVVGEDAANIEPKVGPSTEKKDFRVRPAEVTI